MGGPQSLLIVVVKIVYGLAKVVAESKNGELVGVRKSEAIKCSYGRLWKK